MGKIRVKQLGDEKHEATQKEEAKKRAVAKKEQKTTKLKGKGGGRIADLAQEEVVAAQVAQPEEKITAGRKKGRTPRERTKKYKEKLALIDRSKKYALTDAAKLVKQTSYSKFTGSVEVHINIKEKGLRGTLTLPHGTGKKVRIAIADDKLIEKVSAGKIDFDILVARPTDMARLAKVARILGPRGLMPNPKAGTISAEPEKVVAKLSQGQTQWKTETAAPIVHMVIGKTDFEDNKLTENLSSLIKAIGPEKINTLFVKATMGPAIKVSLE